MIGAPILLKITTLGRFEIRRAQDMLNGGYWNRRKVCELFKLLLAAEQHRLHREQIQEILWPSSGSEQAANSFGKTLYLLRRALEPGLLTGKGSASSYVVLEHDTLMLIPDKMSIDADVFEASSKQLQVRLRGYSSRQDDEWGALLDEFDHVLSCYGGDFLPEDLYEDWAQRRRDRLRRVYCWLLENAAELAIASMMGLRACEYLQALLERNIADEQTHRQLMLVYARMGRRSDAMNQFQHLSTILREELGAQPLPETVELYNTIMAGHITVDLVPSRQPINRLAASIEKIAQQDAIEMLTRTGVLSLPIVIDEEETLQPEQSTVLKLGEPERIVMAKLVGREEETLRLQSAFEEARKGQRRVAFISGEPGIGKTRLAREFANFAEGELQSVVLWGHGYEMGGSLPYQPIIEAIDSHARTCSPEHLRGILGDDAGDLAKISSQVRAKLPNLPQPERLGPEVERQNLYRAVAHYFNTIAAEYPTVIILDDLQWADAATMQLLGYLTAQPIIPGVPLYVLLYRADEVHISHPLRNLLAVLSRSGHVDEIRLMRLNEKAVHQLLANIAGHAVGSVFTSEIYKYTEGNPFFICEALLSLIQEGKVKRVGERWELVVDINELALPQSVRLLIERRLVHISPDCRATLALAAVLGRQFSSALLCQARKLSEEIVAEHLDEALQSYVLVPLNSRGRTQDSGNGDQYGYPQDRDFAFTHDKIREVLYQWLNPLRRRTIHRQLAQAIEVYYASRPQQHYSELAYHYQMAEDYERAVDYFLKAAGHAAHVYAFVDAAGSIENALELLIGDDERVLRAELLRQLAADVYLYLGRPDKAIEAAMASCALWRDLGDIVKEAEARLDVAFAFHWRGRETDSLENIKRALDCLAPVPQETRLLAKAHAQWGMAATICGDTLVAHEQLQRADELHALIAGSDPFISVVTLWARSWYAFLAETPHTMLEYALRGAEICRSTHRFGWEPMMSYSAAWACMLQGRLSEGEQIARDALAKAMSHNAVGAQGWADLVLAFIALQKGHWGEAIDYCDQASSIAELLHDVDLQSRVFWSRGLCSGRQHNWEQAIEHITGGLRLIQQEGEISMIYPHLLIDAAWAYYHIAQITRAQSYLDEGVQLALQRGYRQLPAIAHRLQGCILQQQGKFDSAETYFERALTTFSSFEDTVEYARTQQAYGQFCLARNSGEDVAYGQTLLHSAQETFIRLGMQG